MERKVVEGQGSEKTQMLGSLKFGLVLENDHKSLLALTGIDSLLFRGLTRISYGVEWRDGTGGGEKVASEQRNRCCQVAGPARAWVLLLNKEQLRLDQRTRSPK